MQVSINVFMYWELNAISSLIPRKTPVFVKSAEVAVEVSQSFVSERCVHFHFSWMTSVFTGTVVVFALYSRSRMLQATG